MFVFIQSIRGWSDKYLAFFDEVAYAEILATDQSLLP